MRLQDHLHYTYFKNELLQQININSSTKKIVDAEEKNNENNVDSQEQKKIVNIKWEYDWLLSIYYAKLHGMLWNCRRVKKVDKNNKKL